MWQSIGHEQQKSFLEQSLNSGNFAHAYLFCGPSRTGKKTLALEFAKKILKIDGSKSFNPDLIAVDNRNIRIEDMRRLTADLSLKPYSQSHKVAVIDNFESATDEAANSILKTLEEPAASTIIILIATSRHSVLPTILSRCQVIYFSPLKGTFGAISSEQLISFGGRVADLIQFSNDPEFKESFQSDIAEWQNLQKADRLTRFAAIKRLAESETEEIEIKLNRWLGLTQSEIVKNPSQSRLASALITAIDGVRSNFNKKLVFEKLLLNIGAK
jgi:DNA polymerase III delta prime subunit